MKSVSMGKVAVLTLLSMVTVGACVMMANSDKDNSEETCAGAAVTTYDVAYVAEHSFGGSNAPEYAIPGGNTSFKSYMDFRMITNESSEQYKLQEDCWTDEAGLRRYGDDYVIALGSYYADHIGQRFTITLDNGDTFNAVVGDFKADVHTDRTNRYTPMSDGGKNIIEFVVDTHCLASKARKMGDISYIGGFHGNVQSIEECEE